MAMRVNKLHLENHLSWESSRCAAQAANSISAFSAAKQASQ